MNFLAHLYLAGSDSDLLVGNLMGDFVKGRLEGRYPPPIEKGIELHRRIDSFSGANMHFLRSKRRIDPLFGHYRGVMVDLFYDHFLARHWDRFAEIPFNRFLSDSRLIVDGYRNYLPDRLRGIVPYIFSELLPSYMEIDGISLALSRMSTRIERRNRLGEGGEELKRHYCSLQDDFSSFFPELRSYVMEWKGSVS